MPDQIKLNKKGGTMRLGEYPCKLLEGGFCRKIYKTDLVYERHRHRYEFNNKYKEYLKREGLFVSGLSPDEKLVEIVEMKDKFFFVGVQFHPEFRSRPNRPHPLFFEFIKACLKGK